MDDTRFSATPKQPGEASPKPGADRCCSGRGIAFKAAAVLLTIVSALAGTGLARRLRAPDNEEQPIVKFPNRLFAGWTAKPDLVLILSAQQHGYLLPCGCSHPQVGGLERRYNFLQQIKAAGWPYVAVDLGDIPQQRGPADLPNQQGLIKYVYAMTALEKMKYTAVGFGEYEVNLGLTTVLGEYALNNPVPRVVAGNLIDAEKHYPDQTKPWESAEAANVKVGVTSIVGPPTAIKIQELTHGDKKTKFENTTAALDRVVKEMLSKKIDLPVLLYQGPLTRNEMKQPSTGAVACAEAYPQFPIVLCLCDEDQPPAQPAVVTTRAGSKSLVITLGHKGKFIGVVGVFKTGNPNMPFRFEYERAEMTEDFKTPKDKEKDHPISELMEAYTRDLKDKGYLEKYGQVRHALQVQPEVPGLRNPGEAKYVGAEKCKGCHQDAYDVWKNTKHAHAYQTLVDAERPSNRQYDPECIICHTVGFSYKTGFINETRTPDLKNVSCESCHGPASVHVLNPGNVEWQKRMNPWKYLPKAAQAGAMDHLCQKCHDIDNDVTWINNAFEKKWPKVMHPTPKPKDN